MIPACTLLRDELSDGIWKSLAAVASIPAMTAEKEALLTKARAVIDRRRNTTDTGRYLAMDAERLRRRLVWEGRAA